MYIRKQLSRIYLINLVGCILLTGGGVHAQTQCPSLKAIMVDPCNDDVRNEFIIIDSGSGFNTRDLQIDFNDPGNGLVFENNDINIGVNDLGPPACRFQPGDPSLVLNCPNVRVVSQDDEIPPNAVVIIQMSGNANEAYDFSFLCGTGECVYVLQNDCVRTLEAFRNKGAGSEFLNISLAGTNCLEPSSYNRSSLVNGNGDFYAPDGTSLYGNRACNTATIPAAPPVGGANIPPDFVDPGPLTGCPTVTLPAITGSNLSGRERYYTGPDGTGNFYFPGDKISRNLTLFIFDHTSPCSPQIPIRINIIPPIRPLLEVPIVCALDAPQPLNTTQNGIAGGWSGSGVINNVFHPEINGVGIYLLTFTPNAGECALPNTTLLEVLPSPTITAGATAGACDALGTGLAVFDLTALAGQISGGLAGQIRWFEDAALTRPVPDPEVFVTTATNIFAVLDNGICTSPPVSVALNVGPALDIDLSSFKNLTCAGDTDGEIELEITGGTPPYTIVWSDPAYNGLQVLTGLGVGSYSVTVTDAGGCEESRTATLIAPPVLNFSCSTVQDVTTLGGQDGSASFTLSGGAPPYWVSWFGAVTDSVLLTSPVIDQLISNLPGGTYDLIARDAFGCTAACQFTIDTPPCGLDVSASSTAPDCFGEDGGSITLTASGGQGTITYTWEPNSLNGQSAVSDLPAGIYQVSVSDAVGCVRTFRFDLQGPPQLELDCETVANPSVQGATDGQARVQAAGGTPPYQISWTGPVNGSQSLNTAGDIPLDNLAAGAYEVRITDANGCEQSCSFVLAEGSCSGDISMQSTPAGCTGSADGTIVLTLEGTWVAPIDIDWNIDQYDGQTNLTGLGAGTYSVTVTGANLCQATASISVETGFSRPAADFPSSASICAGSCFTYPLSFSGTAPFLAQFVVHAGSQNIPIEINSDQSTAQLIICPEDYGLSTGSLRLELVRISDANCINDEPKESVLTILEAAESVVSPTLCFGESITVNGQVYDADRPAGTEILPGAGQLGCDSIIRIDITFSTEAGSQVAQTLCPGESITVNGQVYDENRPTGVEVIAGSSAGSCDSSIVIELSFYPPAVGRLERTLCPGEELVVNGRTYNEQHPGGTELFPGGAINGCDSILEVSLSFFPEARAILAETLCPDEQIIVNGTVYDQSNARGTEVLPGQSANGCDSIVQVELSFFDVPVTLIQDTICPSAGLMFNGTTYDFNNPSGMEVLEGGSANGCDSILQIELSFFDSPVTVIRDTLCSSGSLTVNGTVYNKDNPSGLEQISGASSTGCDSLVQVELVFLEDITIALKGDADICAMDSAELEFEIRHAPGPIDIRYTVNGQAGGWIYGVQNGDRITVHPTESAVYAIAEVVLPADYCAYAVLGGAAVSVNRLFVDAVILSDYEGYGVSCTGERNGSVRAQVMEGLPPYLYRWQDGNTSPERSNLGPGVYSVVVTDAAGCVAEASVNLEAPPPVAPEVSTLATDCKSDRNGAIIIDTITGGTGEYHYWLGDDAGQAEAVNAFPVTISGLPPGRYVVNVSDEFGCSNSREVVVAEFVPLELQLGPDQYIEYGASVRLDGVVNFEIDSLEWTFPQYLRSPQSLPTLASPPETTTFVLTAYDRNGCSVSDEIKVFVSAFSNVYLPTAFSPNHDGINDRFYPFTDHNIRQIMEFRIFDRWGNLMHEQFNFQGDSEAFGWDGRFKGQPMDPAVFIYYMKAEYLNGDIKEFKGDFALVR